MNIKRTIYRLDIVSRTMQEKSNLTRIVKTNDNKIIIDDNNNLKGRGCYLSKDKALILKAKKHNLIAKALKCHVSDEIYEQLLK